MSYTVKVLTEREIAEIYNTYMKQDFPPNELKPLSHILRSMEKGYGLLDYFAILKDRRGQGLGHLAFPLFLSYFKEGLPGIEGLYIESERVLAAENETQRRIRERRIAFYRSCGCEMTKLRSVLFGVDYSVLYRPIKEAGCGASKEALDGLYKKMFKPGHYAEFVSLTEGEIQEA